MKMSIPRLLFALSALLTISTCNFASPNAGSLPFETRQATATAETSIIEPVPPDWYAVYFTDPDSPESGTLRGGPDAALAEAIRQARLSVEVAMDNLDLWSLRDALLDAHQRGVVVRVVVESDNLSSAEIQELLEKGIPVRGDRNASLMHNKYVIIDRLEVWTGSMNFTRNGAYRSDNNLIRIRSADLAQDYLMEFEEMFVDGQYGSNSPANTPLPVVTVEGTQVEVYFSPDDGTLERVLELVQKAQEKIDFMAYSFTDDDLALALIIDAQSEVSVSGVLDKSQALSNIGGEYEHLFNNGVDVRLDGNPYSMHHKVIIIDNRIVVTGSYNFSQSARTRNDENTLIIHSPEIAQLFQEEFLRVWDEAEN
jgi:phosphatidylserine/phosphatidylglycerophosphate/cardiolipin synthase-like enzyme